MSDVATSVSSFVKEVLARLKGDDVEVQAIKIERKSRAAIEQQTGALKNKIVDDEEAVKDAEDALKAAIYPTQIEAFAGERGAQNYINGINTARKTLEAKKDALESNQDALKYFKDLLTKFD